jgi:hypothetical protein
MVIVIMVMMAVVVVVVMVMMAVVIVMFMLMAMRMIMSVTMPAVIMIVIFMIIGMSMFLMVMVMVRTAHALGIPVRMKIGHVVIMIFMLFIKYHIKITGIQRRLFHSADPDLRPLQMEALNGFLKNVLISAKVKQCRNRHISTDT